MPITAGQLEPGDILFKHASKGAISQSIAKGQMSHYSATVAAVGSEPTGGAEACDITHVAIAAGPDDVMEFDEGGASKMQIVFGKGHGFVRGDMSLESRRGNRYEVYKCSDSELAAAAVDKAESIADVVGQSRAQASYGLAKMLDTALLHEHGEGWTQARFEEQMDGWIKGAAKTGLAKLLSKKPNIQFFCSEFVAFCYLWAAADTKQGRVLGIEYLLGVDKTRISPVELYTRVDTVGKANFVFKGTLYAA